jgi:hypothetical protein
LGRGIKALGLKGFRSRWETCMMHSLPCVCGSKFLFMLMKWLYIIRFVFLGQRMGAFVYGIAGDRESAGKRGMKVCSL